MIAAGGAGGAAAGVVAGRGGVVSADGGVGRALAAGFAISGVGVTPSM